MLNDGVPLLILLLIITISTFFWGDNNNTTTTVCPLPGTTQVSPEPLPEETFTHSHLSWSSTILYHLPPSATIHSILPVQFMYLTIFCTSFVQVLFGLPLGVEPSISYSIHFSCNHCLLFATHAYTIATCFAVVTRLCHLLIPSFSLVFLLEALSFTLTLYIHLTILISACWSATLFSFLTGQVSLLSNIV